MLPSSSLLVGSGRAVRGLHWRIQKLFKPAKNALSQATGLSLWATKDFEHWLVLQLVLHKVCPKAILEFGSGRSTTYIAEYAHKRGAKFLSIEQNWFFARRLNQILEGSRLPGVVRWVPLQDDWYHLQEVERSLEAFGPCDFAFIDGPTERGGGRRESIIAVDVLTRVATTARVIVIDDIDRESVRWSAGKILNNWDRGSAFVYDYERFPTTKFAFVVREDIVQTVREINAFIGLTAREVSIAEIFALEPQLSDLCVALPQGLF